MTSTRSSAIPSTIRMCPMPTSGFSVLPSLISDESGRRASVIEIVRKAHKLGINPGGEVLVREVKSIPDEYKNRLITDDALLLKLGSRGRSITQYQ